MKFMIEYKYKKDIKRGSIDERKNFRNIATKY